MCAAGVGPSLPPRTNKDASPTDLYRRSTGSAGLVGRRAAEVADVPILLLPAVRQRTSEGGGNVLCQLLDTFNGILFAGPGTQTDHSGLPPTRRARPTSAQLANIAKISLAPIISPKPPEKDLKETKNRRPSASPCHPPTTDTVGRK